MIDVVWDMETGDPDDYFTLLLLIGHPEVNLKAVTVTPGAPDQMGLVKKVLDNFKLNIPIGSFNIDHPKKCVSSWYHKMLGKIKPFTNVRQGADIIMENCDEETTIITGGPLKNLGSAIIKYPNLEVGRLVAQGGFAGEGVVPDHLQLEKFRCMRTCATYNLNGDPQAGLRVLSFEGIKIKRFVSKNVCHGVYYDRELHNQLGSLKMSGIPEHLKMIYFGMDKYLEKHPKGKKFHDPLAACAAIDESIIDWREVEIFREKGKWGSRLRDGSNVWISVDYDREKFIKTLLAI